MLLSNFPISNWRRATTKIFFLVLQLFPSVCVSRSADACFQLCSQVVWGGRQSVCSAFYGRFRNFTVIHPSKLFMSLCIDVGGFLINGASGSWMVIATRMSCLVIYCVAMSTARYYVMLWHFTMLVWQWKWKVLAKSSYHPMSECFRQCPWWHDRRCPALGV